MTVCKSFLHKIWGCGILWQHNQAIHKSFLHENHFPPIYKKFSPSKVSHYTLSGCILCVLTYQLKLTQILLVPQVAQLINYAKNLHEEEKHIVRTLRLQQDAIW